MKLSHWGRVFGPVGLVLLVVSVLTIFLVGDSWLGFINVALGLLFVSFYLATNFRELGEKATGRGSFYALISALGVVFVTGGLLAANYLAIKHPKTWDVTQAKIHTLSDDTVKTVQGLKEPVEVTAFYKAGERETPAFEALFAKYQALSTEKFKYKLVDPEQEPVLTKEMDVRPGGPRVVVKLGAHEARVSAPTEEELTNALVKVTHSVQKKVYFVTGHGEADPTDRGQTGLSKLAERMANEGLQSATLALVNVQEVPKDAEAVVVAGAQKPLAKGEVEMLQKYLQQGGKLMVLAEPMADSGLESLLEPYGIKVDPGIVVDVSAQRIFQTSAFMPVVVEYPEGSPITHGFRMQTAFPTAASLTIGGAKDAVPQALLNTLPGSWVETKPEVEPIEHNEGEKLGPLTLGATVTQSTAKADAATKRSDEARLVVVGDKDFAVNSYLAMLGNEDFALNCLNWLTAQTERISIRPRSREASRLMLSAAQMSGVRFFATELPIGLLALGLAIYFNRRAK